MKRSVSLLGEDIFCLAVLERIMAYLHPDVAAKSLPPAMGVAKLRPILVPFVKTGRPLIVLADSDGCCPAKARREIEPLHASNVIVRIAVREADAWVLGDPAIAEFLDAPVAKIPRAPETLADPKEELIRFAGHSRNPGIRRRMIRDFPHQSQPAGYNGLVPVFVRQRWDPVVASERCPSLKKAIRRLNESSFLR